MKEHLLSVAQLVVLHFNLGIFFQNHLELITLQDFSKWLQDYMKQDKCIIKELALILKILILIPIK